MPIVIIHAKINMKEKKMLRSLLEIIVFFFFIFEKQIILFLRLCFNPFFVKFSFNKSGIWSQQSQKNNYFSFRYQSVPLWKATLSALSSGRYWAFFKFCTNIFQFHSIRLRYYVCNRFVWYPKSLWNSVRAGKYVPIFEETCTKTENKKIFSVLWVLNRRNEFYFSAWAQLSC